MNNSKNIKQNSSQLTAQHRQHNERFTEDNLDSFHEVPFSLKVRLISGIRFGLAVVIFQSIIYTILNQVIL